MAWSASKIFAATVEGMLEKAANIPDMDGDTFHATLWDNDNTPDNTVALANTAYNAGQWATAGNEVSDGTNWDAGGEPLTGVSSGLTAAVYKFDASDTPQGGATCTLANVYGTMVYSQTSSADYGVSFHYFGGVQSVTGGTFTIVWSGSGIFTLTMT